MTIGEWLRVAAVLAVLFGGLPVIRCLVIRSGAGPEVSRKAVHVGMGLVCSIFPWIFDRPLPVWILAAMATVPLLVLRAVPSLKAGVGSTLHGISRPSYGEVLFAPSVAAVFHMAHGEPLLHLIPVAILAIADAAGALMGTRWGKRQYGSGEGFKTVEGSAAFMVTAFLAVFLPLVVVGGFDPVKAMWIGLIMGLLVMMAEGLADRGFDNLIIPLGSFFILSRLVPLDTAHLVVRFVVASGLLAFVLSGSRWSTLSGGALLGCSLLGYGCAIMADYRFAFPALGIFVCHLVTTRKNRFVGVFDHRLDAVLSHAMGCLPWVILVERKIISDSMGLLGVSIAMASQLGILDMATYWWLRQKPSPIWRSMMKGWVFAALPGLVWFWPDYSPLLLPVSVALLTTTIAISAFRSVRPQDYFHPTRLWLLKGFVALLSSLPALLLPS